MSTMNVSNSPGIEPSAPSESSGVKDQAQQAAGTASDEGQRVAGVAQAELKNVTAEAQNQLRGLLDQATSQMDEQSREQKGRLAETVRTFGDDLRGMTSESSGGGLAAQLVQQVGDQARGLASHLEDRSPSELLDDVRSYARRRPGTFLLGALAAGVVAGRVTRGAKAAQSNPSPRVGDVSAPPLTTSPPRTALTDDAWGTVGTPVPADTHPQTDLGVTGVEISEAGVASSTRGPA